MERVVIGMSGGVDSSVAAAVLKEQGYEVVGVTMRLWDGDDSDGSCCSLSAVEDAKRVADELGIEFHVLDFRKEFSEFVIDYFTNEYINGRTPNPCIVCNQFLKFGLLLEKAKELGAQKIATGHYAKIEFDAESGRYLLKRADSSEKDQTYALYRLTQEQLSHIIMPLGDFGDKEAVRKKADELNLPTAKKADSMEICFIPDNDYVSFIEKRCKNLPPKGNFVDINGNIIGRHQGIINYTIGQRKGLGIAFGRPMFVVKIDKKNNEVVLGEKGTEFTDSLVADNWNFISIDEIENPIRTQIKVRYSARPAWGEVSIEDGLLKVKFDEPQRAVTPGQAVVFYDGDTVVGGATILQ